MSEDTILGAVILGIVEGATEFLPVSSTAHLIVAADLLGFSGGSGKVFEIVIQAGAILAICVLYIQKLLQVLTGLGRDPAARRFAMAVIVAFLPAAVIGVILHDFIKTYLFSPYIVAISFIVGGLLILLIEFYRPEPRLHQVEQFSLRFSLGVGFIQCLAMIPGVSRSGATILGAMMLGADRKAAAEFSFFLAIPTIVGASVYDLWKNRAGLAEGDSSLLIAVGFVAAFVSALAVVKWLIGYVSRHDFVPFAWYRIAAGIALVILLATGVLTQQ
jgi:undecaprenyl-diphosphatase